MIHASSTLPVGRGIWYVGIAAVAWGTGGAAAAALYATTGLDPVTVSWWRFLSGFALLAIARRWVGTPSTRTAATKTTGTATTGTATTSTPTRTAAERRRRALAALRTMLVTGVGLAVYQTAYYVSIDRAGLAVATVVTLGAGPVFIALGGHLTRIERLHRGAVLAVLTAVLGLALLTATGPDASTAAHPTDRLAGIGFALLSAAGYAVVTLLTRRGQDAIGRYDAAVGGFAVGAVLLAPLAAVTGSWPTGFSGTDAVLLVYLAVVPTALAYALFFAGLAAVKATTAAVVTLVEPVTATLVAVALLGEVLTPSVAAGSAVLLAAVVALAVAERRRPAPTPVPAPTTDANRNADHQPEPPT